MSRIVVNSGKMERIQLLIQFWIRNLKKKTYDDSFSTEFNEAVGMALVVDPTQWRTFCRTSTVHFPFWPFSLCLTRTHFYFYLTFTRLINKLTLNAGSYDQNLEATQRNWIIVQTELTLNANGLTNRFECFSHFISSSSGTFRLFFLLCSESRQLE